MTWIQTIAPSEATGELEKLYRRVAGPNGVVDNVLSSHSLRPHTMEGHMGLYKSVLHDSANQLERWYLELVGVWTSRINGCEYCTKHHTSGLLRCLIQARGSSAQQFHAKLLAGFLKLESGGQVAAAFGDSLDPAQCAGLSYAAKLTRNPSALLASDLDALREAGWDDGRILELNQVTSYFNYVNRTVLGLGVALEKEPHS